MNIVDGFCLAMGAMIAVVVVLFAARLLIKSMSGGLREMSLKDFDQIVKQREALEDYETCKALLEARKHYQHHHKWPSVLNSCIQSRKQTKIKLDNKGLEIGIVKRFRWRDDQ